MKENLERMQNLKNETNELDDKNFLTYILEYFKNKIAFASSFGIEDQVLTHMLLETNRNIQIFTIDTGRLPQETYDTIEITREKYDIDIDFYFPAWSLVEEMVNKKGPNLFYKNVNNRKICCHIRRVSPLQRKLETLDSWITGLRREQSYSRADIERVDWDEINQKIKINPLAFWTLDQVWDFARKKNIPYNKLHDKGCPSIGCLPCTMAINPGEDVRAGRWWWEENEQKECGIHYVNGKIVRLRNMVFE